MEEARDTLTLPRNIKRAFFSIAACGQATEEFWWSNVLSSNTLTFGNTTLYGYSPWRELRLYIDGELAGVAWPFPVIFTGGINPGFWRPIAGINTYDLKEDEIDITPWLPVLADGNEHEFEVRVAGLEDNGSGNVIVTETVGSNWVVTGKIFLWLDTANSITTGSTRSKSNLDPVFQATSAVGMSNGTNSTLRYQVLAQRDFSITSTIKTSEGEKDVSWRQTLSFTNMGDFSRVGEVQVNNQTTSGVGISSSGFSRRFTYPLNVYSDFSDQTAVGGNVSIYATFNRGKDLEVFGRSAFPCPLDLLPKTALSPVDPSSFNGYNLRNSQSGVANFLSSPSLNNSIASGTTKQSAVLGGLESSGVADGRSVPVVRRNTTLWERSVEASNSSIVRDEETPFVGAGSSKSGPFVPDRQSRPQYQDFALFAVKSMLGRGPRGPYPGWQEMRALPPALGGEIDG